MYKIVELNEREISNYKGKILQVINSTKQSVVVGRDYFGGTLTSILWVLTCLVEE